MSGRYNRGGSYRGRGNGGYGYYRGGRGGSSGGYYHPYDNSYGFERRPFSVGRQYSNSSAPPSTANESGEYDYYASEEQHVTGPQPSSTSEPNVESPSSSSNNNSRDISREAPLDSSPAISRPYYQQPEYYSSRGNSRGAYRGRGGGYRGGYYQNRDPNFGYYYNEQEYEQFADPYNYEYYGKGYEESVADVSYSEDLINDPRPQQNQLQRAQQSQPQAQLQPPPQQQRQQPPHPPGQNYQRKSYYENHSYHDSRIPTSGRHSNSPYNENSVLEEERKQKESKELKEKKEQEERDSLNHWVLRLDLKGEVKESVSKSLSELAKINESIRGSSEKRLRLEIEVGKLDRLTKNEELKCKLTDEKLEAMNFV